MTEPKAFFQIFFYISQILSLMTEVNTVANTTTATAAAATAATAATTATTATATDLPPRLRRVKVQALQAKAWSGYPQLQQQLQQ